MKKVDSFIIYLRDFNLLLIYVFYIYFIFYENVVDIIIFYDLVLDCIDNLVICYFIFDVCVFFCKFLVLVVFV